MINISYLIKNMKYSITTNTLVKFVHKLEYTQFAVTLFRHL